jgi:hypothetical protein
MPMYLLAGMVLVVGTGSLVSAALAGAGCSCANSAANPAGRYTVSCN